MARYADESNTEAPSADTSGNSAVDTTQASGTDQAASSDEGKDTSAPAPETVAPENTGSAPVLDNEVVPENPSDPSTSEKAEEVTSPRSTRTENVGVQTGGLTYVEGKDDKGEDVRHYPEQKPVEVVESPDA
jgi:hypothetical protein